MPSVARERPTAASERTSGVHPGRLAQGPDEKSGRTGREFGFINLSLTEELHSVGGAWPAARIRATRPAVNACSSARGFGSQLVIGADRGHLEHGRGVEIVVQYGIERRG